MAGFIDAAVQDIDNRLKELREEEARLQAARDALVGRAAARPARATAAAPRAARSSRPRGRRGGATRATQALKLVRERPGITIPEIAAAMKIEPNYLYRVLPKLASDGHVTRSGQGWHPAQTEAA